MEKFGTINTLLSVSQLTSLIKGELEAAFPAVSVAGEISNFRRQSSGHCYFSLKDEFSLINAVLFRGNAARVSFVLRDGMSVVAYGEISVYEARGQYQLVVRSLQPVGVGDLQARFEALKKKLQNEGLFDATKKRPLPRHPRTVVVITSLSAAALHDFLKVLGRRAPQITVLVMPVPVQGKEAPPAICRAIGRLNRWISTGALVADVVAVIRGGGSLEDLWAFNEEIVARAIASCVLPTVSGVGHETDFTITDLVADVRAPTPSAAAELLSANHADLVEKIDSLKKRMAIIVNSHLSKYRLQLESFASNSTFRHPLRIVEKASQRLDDLAVRLNGALRLAITSKLTELEKISACLSVHHPRNKLRFLVQQLNNIEDKLVLLDPRNALRLGYAWVKNLEGKLLRSPAEVQDGEMVEITLKYGTLQASAIKHNQPTETESI
jgi:exodeoxyribonuclease VII large subunit